MSAKENSVSAPRTYVVLCVDDHVAGLVTRKAFLEAFGYTVQTVTNGPAALALVRQIPPDVVLLDYRMPGMDGLQVAEQMKSSGLNCRSLSYPATCANFPRGYARLLTLVCRKAAHRPRCWRS